MEKKMSIIFFFFSLQIQVVMKNIGNSKLEPGKSEKDKIRRYPCLSLADVQRHSASNVRTSKMYIKVMRHVFFMYFSFIYLFANLFVYLFLNLFYVFIYSFIK